MANRKNLLLRLKDAVVGPSVEELVEKQVNERLSKASTGDIIRFSPSSMALPSGTVRKPYPLGVSFGTLRDFADYYPIARACIEFRKSQITHLDWAITPIEVTDQSVQDQTNIKNAAILKQFFRYPTGQKDSSFTNWIKQILEDSLVIDAVAVYRRRNRRGDVIGYLPVDGASIELLIRQDGTTPEPPEDAYVQKIKGKEVARLTTDELIYAIMTPRTYSAYGFAPLETLIITVTTALKLQAFNLAFLTEGNVPEGFVTLPKDIASSRDQLKEWQDAWDAMLSGDPRFQKKLKFLPEGMKYEPTVKPDDMNFERFEKWLLQTTCAIFGIHPSAIGFNFDVNRGSAQTAWEAGRERGLFPTALFLKEMLDRMIQDDLGHPELQLTWTNLEPTNKKEEAQVVKTLLDGGLISIDEWRLGEGLKPIGANDPFLMTPVGPIFVKDLIAQSQAGQQPVAPYKPTGSSGKPADQGGGSNSSATASLPIPSQAKVSDSVVQDNYVTELKKWRKAAFNDLKEHRPPRNFKSDIIDSHSQDLIMRGLIKASTKEDITKVFEVFLGQPYQIQSALLNLYEGINRIIAHNQAGNAAN